MDGGVAAAPISPPAVTRWRHDYLPAYLSNGLIGARVGKIPMLEGLVIVSGLAAVHPKEKVEGFARGPYPFAGDVSIDGAKASERREQVKFVSQRYDFSCGELHTQLRFVAPTATAAIEVLTFCSRSRPTVVVQETRITLDASGELALTAKLDPTGIDGQWLAREVGVPATDRHVVDGSLLWGPPGGLSQCGAAYWTELVGATGAKMSRDEHTERAPLATTYTLRARRGRTYVLRQMASLIASDFHRAPQRQATRMVSLAAQEGFDRLREANRTEWEGIWRGRVVLVGADSRWQAMTDAAHYYLHASAHRSSLFSTSMFGLAYWPDYHYYRGQVMWDIEAFAHLPLALTQPGTAEALLDYRVRHLETAKSNAAMNGYAGAQFPWASTPMSGDEGIRTSAPLVLFEQHVGLVIALALARQVHITGDEDYLHRRAWPAIESVARWIESRWVRTARGLEIRDALGIAEQREHPIENPAYVAMAAKRVLRETACFAERLARGGAEKWRRLADDIRIPVDARRNVVKSHETFTARATGRSAATPEPLAGIFPVEYELDEELARSTTRFYLDRVDPYVGSPMLPPLLGLHAARIGERERAQQLLEEGYAEYVFGPYMETDEFSRARYPDQPRKGPFTANLAGFLGSCLVGMTGVRITADDPPTWPARPPAMPAGWDGVLVERLTLRGRAARLEAREGDERARIEFES